MGMAVMLDVIINYIQSLQNQIEVSNYIIHKTCVQWNKIKKKKLEKNKKKLYHVANYNWII